jgi:uncharacterized membrane protein
MRQAFVRVLPFVVVGVAFLLSALAWPHLPERMPVHWGLSGEPDRWGARLEGALLLPAITLGTVLLLRFLPRIDPRRANYEKMREVYDFVIALMATVMLGIHSVVLATALGHDVPIATVVPAFIGLLFILLGNVLPKARSNWWFGVRTPWTLSSDRVWSRTHRVAGFTFVVAGLLLLLSPVVPPPLRQPVLVGAIVVATVIPVVFSYFAWRSERSNDPA